MAAAGLGSGLRTFTIWEGVLSYLTPDAVDATLRWASEISGAGSELVFTYVHGGLLDGSQHFPHAESWVESVRAAGEPFVFGLDPSTHAAYLAERQWRLLDDLSTPEALVRYGRSAARVPGFYRIAHARVIARSRSG
jgi:methyltransferase (TIGR00027 family)